MGDANYLKMVGINVEEVGKDNRKAVGATTGGLKCSVLEFEL